MSKVATIKSDSRVAAIRAAIADAFAAADLAVNKAIVVGHMLIEEKARQLAADGRGNFQKWIEENLPINYDRANHWMNVASACLKGAGLDSAALPDSPERLLNAPESELSEAGLEARQLLLDFTKDKTMADCLRAVTVEGDAAHRITRAHNGKSKGGHDGGDRKDFPKFIGVHLSDITAHLKFYKSFTGVMVETIESKFKAAIAKWPSPLLEAIKKLITEELKTR